MPLDDLRFTPALMTRPPPRGLAAETSLRHFSIVTFCVDPDRLRAHLHARFEPDIIPDTQGRGRALVSVVTFLDEDFRFVACPWPRNTFGQTNYRSYVTDTATGEHVAWFFGTCLDSLSVVIPRYLWRIPWHRARMTFDCRYNGAAARYETIKVRTSSKWAPARLELEDLGRPPRDIAGFSNREAGLVLLTQPTRGFFFRRDGALGSYSIWHDRMAPNDGVATVAEFPLLDRLGLVAEGDLEPVHSVLIQPRVDFTIYLPPVRTRPATIGA